MNARHHVGLLDELSAQFQRLASQACETGGTSPVFGGLAHELLHPVRLEAITATLLIERLRAGTPADANEIADDLLKPAGERRSRLWRGMGESFRRAHLPGQAGLCVQLEASWKGRPQLPPRGEEVWQQTAGGFARWLYDHIVRLARAPDSA